MLQIELNINGLIASLSQIVRKECLDTEAELYRYEVRFYRAGSGELKFKIKHKISDGSEVLAAKVFSSLIRNKKYKIWIEEWNKERQDHQAKTLSKFFT